jgi:uncharacterized membrane protein YdjX (TVP38/TMEM64 family)
MTVLIIVGVLPGVATASRLRAIAVVPVMALMMATIVLFETARGEMVWWLAATAGMSIQLGYFAGAILRSAIHAKRERESNGKTVR